MTATVILQLQQEGELAITDPISRYIPGVPDGDSITIQQLAEMRSGLYSYADDPGFAATLEKQPDTVWTPQQLLGIAFAHPQNFPPGRQYEYSNTNYVLLGLVIEKVTGTTAAAALKARIFDPLGLRNTMLPAAADAALPDPHPRGYMWGPMRRLTDHCPRLSSRRHWPEISSPPITRMTIHRGHGRPVVSSLGQRTSPTSSRRWWPDRCSTTRLGSGGW